MTQLVWNASGQTVAEMTAGHCLSTAYPRQFT